MFSPLPSNAATWSFEQTLTHLGAHPSVLGLLTIGSTASGHETPASDYDLVVVVADAFGPVRLALTTIAGRLADVLFVTGAQLERWPEPGGAQAWPPAQLARWLRGGRIVSDRLGLLAKTQARALTTALDESPDQAARAATWFSVNYNLAQTRRMLASDDPVYRTAVALRLLYSLTDLWHAYFDLRDLPHRGEKAQIRHVMEADPAFLASFMACLGETDPAARWHRYADLARHSLAPVGDLWPADATGVLPWSATDDDPEHSHASAVTAWRSLFTER